jgi:type IV pilus assembly protein PilQ
MLMNLDVGGIFRNGLSLLVAISGMLICACSTPPETKVDAGDKAPGAVVIQSVRTEATPQLTKVTFACSQPPVYGKPYALVNPARLCFDIQGSPAGDLPGQVTMEAGPVKEILIQEKAPGQTEVVVYARYEVTQTRLVTEEKDIVLEVIPASAEKVVEQVQPPPAAPTPSLPQIMDVAVTQRPGNRTRLSIITDKKVDYDVKLEGTTLIVDLKNGAIRPDLIKKLESEHAEGAVQQVQAFYSALDRHVSLKVLLRQLIPYHITRDGTELNIDFDAVRVETAQRRRPAPVAPAQGLRPAEPASARQTGAQTGQTEKASPEQIEMRAGLFEATSRQYAGQKMSFDFVDTDIRNILQLISEVAGINIVWGSDVEGKISMKLDSIPWDQALEMILRPNGLTYQIEDDVLWVVPKEKLRDLEIKEGKRKGALLASKRVQGIFEAKIIEFITIRHRKAADVFKMLVGDQNAVPPIPPALDIEAAESEEEEEGEEEKGKKVKIATLDLYLSYDAGTNMIIANGVRAKVDKVKELIAKLDVAEKQVLIEARIVEATTGFTRDLGIQWQSLDKTRPGFRSDWINTSANFLGDTQFSTNAPANWTPNIGLAFGWLTGGGLGSISLDASLALGETDHKAHIISAPKVLTVNGGEAFISRGTIEYFPIRTLDTIDYEQIPAVLSLKVTPTVSADNSHVTLGVDVTDDKRLPQRTTTSGGITEESPPGRSTKTIKSTLMVKTGDTVVIGGIYQKEDSTSDSGVPWLKDIPLLGWLFKAQYDTRARTELLIFLTPTVVDPLKMTGG